MCNYERVSECRFRRSETAGRKGEQKEEERTRRENVSGIFSENDRRSRQKSVGRGGRASGGREGECGVSMEGSEAEEYYGMK